MLRYTFPEPVKRERKPQTPAEILLKKGVKHCWSYGLRGSCLKPKGHAGLCGWEEIEWGKR